MLFRADFLNRSIESCSVFFVFKSFFCVRDRSGPPGKGTGKGAGIGQIPYKTLHFLTFLIISGAADGGGSGSPRTQKKRPAALGDYP